MKSVAVLIILHHSKWHKCVLFWYDRDTKRICAIPWLRSPTRKLDKELEHLNLYMDRTKSG